jgi:pyruvate,water dikinase
MDTLYELSAQIEQLMFNAKVPPELETAISRAWQQTENEAGFEITAAMRSSAIGEDESGTSFAGIHRSELNVSAGSVCEAYREIIASKYSPQAIMYRHQKGLIDEDIMMCVGCLVMIDAIAGGVAYSGNPSNIHDDAIFINSAWGLPKAVVDGRINNDLFVVARTEPMRITQEEIHDKTKKFVCYPLEGICRLDSSSEKRTQPSLTHAQVLSLAKAAIAIERHYGVVQDIEWAIDHNGDLYILQCRPLQQKDADEDGSQRSKRTEEAAAVLEGGRIASPGAASGRAFIIEREADILSFPDGAILVTRQALPRWAMVLSRAAGVIAERGGVAGHLANVAREFGIPALFGLAAATTHLSSGDLITLDASGRAVHPGRIEALLQQASRAHFLMKNSPVFKSLNEVSRLITPLNLIDPYSSEFTPQNCQTLHDITRFAHEKAVNAMFTFGENKKFSKWVSKQLYVNGPMQWWIINLDDGLNKVVAGKYVRLEDIASMPMLAFWEGFTSIPWAGPPAIDGKGFMSVMFQSTRNPLLARGLRTARKDNNYFMITRNYCHLNSKLGYHFSTLEAFMSEKLDENYVKFQFRGGAADGQRRIRRILLIADLLEHFGFRVNTREDNLAAQVNGYDLAFTRQRLRLLGYLSLHTRQLDMIMGNETVVTRYKNKFINDINKIIENSHHQQ